MPSGNCASPAIWTAPAYCSTSSGRRLALTAVCAVRDHEQVALNSRPLRSIMARDLHQHFCVLQLACRDTSSSPLDLIGYSFD
jgi:hypothetical protein